MDRLNTKGFTLIELMIVITLLGILASIAVPVYNEHTRKAHRATAKSSLMEDAQYLERYYTTHNTYNDTLTPDPPVLPITTTEGAKYTIAINFTDPTIDFQLTATPAGSQASDSCGTLTINQLGAKTPTTGNCW